MARPRGFRSRVSGSSRRLTAWGVGPGSSTGTGLTSSSAAIVGGGLVPVVNALTLVRTRGVLSLTIEAIAAAGDGFHGAFGLLKVTDEAFAAGITALPHPIDDVDYDGWWYHTFFDLHSITATIADGSNSDALSKRIEIDSKAMRKLKIGETLCGVVQVVEDGTSTITIFFDLRLLFKLP